MSRNRLELSLQTVSKCLRHLRVGESDSPGVTRGRGSRDSYHLLGHPPQRLVSGVSGFKGSAPLVIPPIVKPVGHRHLEAVNIGFQSGVPGDLPPPLQRFFMCISS
jgi:hypothetical protein